MGLSRCRTGLAVVETASYDFAMGETRSSTSARAIALALALVAITFNFLQPLAHAAALRDGVPGALWLALCKGSAADLEDEKQSAGKVKVSHECCLGLAHAPIVPDTTQVFVPTVPLTVKMQRPAGADPSAAFAIRDGPHQPRAPPTSFA